MKNKRGILIGNSLKLIIAVVVMALLFLGAVKLYQVALGDNDMKSAVNILEKVKAKSDALQVGENTTMTLAGFDSTENWIITGWGKNDSSSPDKCFFSSCICVCSLSSPWVPNAEVSPSCQKRGKCEDTEIEKIEINGAYYRATGWGPMRENISYIPIPRTFSELQFQKSKDSEGNTVLTIKI